MIATGLHLQNCSNIIVKTKHYLISVTSNVLQTIVQGDDSVAEHTGRVRTINNMIIIIISSVVSLVQCSSEDGSPHHSHSHSSQCFSQSHG